MKTYFQFQVTQSGSTFRVPVVSLGDHREAIKQIESEWQQENGKYDYIRDWPMITHALPDEIGVAPLDMGMRRTCWSSGRIDDFIFNVGDGTTWVDDGISRVSRAPDAKRPRIGNVTLWVMRQLMTRDMTGDELKRLARMHGVRFAGIRVGWALRVLWANALALPVTTLTFEETRNAWTAVPATMLMLAVDDKRRKL